MLGFRFRFRFGCSGQAAPVRGVVSALAVLILLAAAPSARGGLSKGDAPSYQLNTLKGDTLTASKLRGRIVVMTFWSSASRASVDRLPRLNEIHELTRDKGITMLGVCCDEKAASAREFVESHEMSWPQVFDDQSGHRLRSEWGVQRLPHTLIFSPRGALVWRGHPARLEGPLEAAYRRHRPDQGGGGRVRELSKAQARKAVEALRTARAALHVDEKRSAQFDQMLAAIGDVPPHAARAARVRQALDKLAEALAQATRTNEQKRAYGLSRQTARSAARRFSRLLLRARRIENGRQSAGNQRARLVEQRAAAADEAHQAGRRGEAYDLYQWLAAQAPNTDAGRRAAKRIAAYEADASFMKKRKQRTAAKRAAAAMSMARNYKSAGKTKLARQAYRKVVDRYAGTKAAQQAQRALKQMSH